MPNDMRDRLIELIQDIKLCNPTNWYKPEFMALALLANGVILPPCVPKNDEYYRVYDEHGNYIAVIYSEKGKTVFLTREDAEKALGERE